MGEKKKTAVLIEHSAMSEEPTVTLGGPGAQPSRLRRKRAPAMSLTSLNLGGEVPPFFTFVVEAKLAACGDFDPEKVCFVLMVFLYFFFEYSNIDK